MSAEFINLKTQWCGFQIFSPEHETTLTFWVDNLALKKGNLPYLVWFRQASTWKLQISTSELQRSHSKPRPSTFLLEIPTSKPEASISNLKPSTFLLEALSFRLLSIFVLLMTETPDIKGLCEVWGN
jgi:hypothetical protein